MTELRPLFALGEPPLTISPGPRPQVVGSVRPLFRGLMLVVALGLPVLGTLVTGRFGTATDAPSSKARSARLSGMAP